jgi:hypothetical protein
LTLTFNSYNSRIWFAAILLVHFGHVVLCAHLMCISSYNEFMCVWFEWFIPQCLINNLSSLLKVEERDEDNEDEKGHYANRDSSFCAHGDSTGVVKPVVFLGLDVDPELDCVGGLEIPVGVAKLEVSVWAVRSLSSHIITIAVAIISFSAIRVDVGVGIALLMPL